jgi:hypothetical protein
MNFQYQQFSNARPVIAKYLSLVNAGSAEVLWQSFSDFTELKRIEREIDMVRSQRPDLKKFSVEICFELSLRLKNEDLINLVLEFFDLSGYTKNQNVVLKILDQPEVVKLLVFLNRVNFNGFVVPDNYEYSRLKIIATQLITMEEKRARYLSTRGLFSY